jgi:hypothetical protein
MNRASRPGGRPICWPPRAAPRGHDADSSAGGDPCIGVSIYRYVDPADMRRVHGGARRPAPQFAHRRLLVELLAGFRELLFAVELGHHDRPHRQGRLRRESIRG